MKYFIPQRGNIGDDINSLRDTYYKCITNVGSFKNVNHEMNSDPHIEYLPCVRQMLIFIFCLG